MNTAVIGLIVAVALIVGIYFLFVVPGERKYHETKLRLMQERIERHEQRRKGDQTVDSSDPPSQGTS